MLRLYRSTPPSDMELVAGPLRERDPDTLVVWGDADVYIPAVQAQRQREVFSRAPCTSSELFHLRERVGGTAQ